MNLEGRLISRARRSRLALFLAIGLGIGAGLLTVAQAGILSRVVGRVFLEGRSPGDVLSLMASLLAVMILRALLTWGESLASSAVALRVKTELRRELYRRIQDLGPGHLHGERTGDLVNVTVEGVEALDAYFSQYLPGLILAALVPLTVLVFVFQYDPLSALVLLLTAPLIPLFMVLIGDASQALTRRRWRDLSRMSAYFLDVIQGLTTLKILGRSREQSEEIARVSDRFRRTTMGVLRVTFLSALVLEMVATLSTAVVAVEVGLRLLNGRLAFEQALFVLILAPEFYLPLRLLGARFHAGIAGSAAARRIFDLLGTPAGGNVHPPERTGPARPLDSRKEAPDVLFEDVHYSYGSERAALRGVSLRIPAGGTAALVGPSGGGKSTVAALLLGFLQPEGGRIAIDGQPLSELTPDEWRSQIAWLPQRPHLFNDTVAANIRLARPEATMVEVVEAAEAAGAGRFIRALPDGFETSVGERGARLSGGQAQRVALARAFLKDAPLVILDEAAANLDPESEAGLSAALDRLLAGRSALIIAHRLNTTRRAEQIFVLDRGRVAQSGTHAALLEEGGLYRQMVHAYAEGAPSQPDEPPSPLDRPPLETNPPAPFFPDIFERIPSGAQPPAPSGRYSPLRTTLRLLKLMAPFKGLAALSALVGAATVLSGIGLMAASAYIIAAAALGPSIAELQVAIVSVRLFGITRGVFRYLERTISHSVTFRLLARLRVWFYQALEPLAPARLMSYRGGDLLARILGDIETLEGFYVRALAPPLAALLVALATFALLARFDPLLGFAWMGFYIAAGAVLPWFVLSLSRRPGREAVEARAALSAAVVDGVQGLADLTAYGQARRQASMVDELSWALGESLRRLSGVDGFGAAALGLLANLGMWSVLWLAIPMAGSGRIDGVYLAALALVALTSFEALVPLPQAAQHLERGLRAARRLYDIVDAEPQVDDPARPRPMPQKPALRVEGLRFCYPEMALPGTLSIGVGRILSRPDAPLALDGISFSLTPGERVAVVGPSGAGKSTLIHLLLRFWDLLEWRILLDGYPLGEYAQDDLRKCIGVVSQSPYLFSASVLDNLRVARPGASQAEIEGAARGAQIHDFIQSLPQGYDTWIGEHGALLSGGERQRLAIARALLKDPPLLLLDEPTANLDPLVERRVLAAIHELMAGRSVLVATHRLVGLEGMDEILVLDGGRVVERGRHAELLEAGGLYRRMWDLQNQVLGR